MSEAAIKSDRGAGLLRRPVHHQKFWRVPLERFPLDLNREGYRGSLGRANQIRCLRRQRRGYAMAKGYSKDLRERVVSIVEEGDSAREAARLLNVGASTAIRWIERWTTTGSVEAKPGTGHSRSPLNKHQQWLLDLIAAEPDLTLDDIRLRLSGAKKLKVGTSSIWRFYDRQEITFKKNSARRRAGAARRGRDTATLEGRPTKP